MPGTVEPQPQTPLAAASGSDMPFTLVTAGKLRDVQAAIAQAVAAVSDFVWVQPALNGTCNVGNRKSAQARGKI